MRKENSDGIAYFKNEQNLRNAMPDCKALIEKTFERIYDRQKMDDIGLKRKNVF